MFEHGQLRVWWIPQVPGKPFHVDVSSFEEGELITKVLADYDQFQFKNNIKPDYCNTGGIQVWLDDLEPTEDGSKWCDVDSEESLSELMADETLTDI